MRTIHYFKDADGDLACMELTDAGNNISFMVTLNNGYEIETLSQVSITKDDAAAMIQALQAMIGAAVPPKFPQPRKPVQSPGVKKGVI